MIIPSKVVGRKKLRNAAVCKLWLTDCWTCEEIGKRFGVSKSRIDKILSINAHLLIYEKDREKRNRIHLLKRMLKRRGETTRADTTALIEQIRREIEGEKAALEINTYNQIWNGVTQKAKDVDESGRIRNRISDAQIQST